VRLRLFDREARDREWRERWQRGHRWDELARYNTERGRGLVHTPEYDRRMADEQRLFNERPRD
jgi:hypothetical protein